MLWRLEVYLRRFVVYLLALPHRLLRLFYCLLGFQKFYGPHKLVRRLAGSFLLLIDVTPVPWLMACLLDSLKWKTRSMTSEEKSIAREIFGDSIPYDLCTFDPDSFFAKKKITSAYTFLHTINFDDHIPANTMIHELVHVWQYCHLGALYISEAIWSQRWGGGYNYGGYEALVKNKERGLQAFNLEQQAEIVEDYFRLKKELPLQWSASEVELEVLLQSYILEVRV